jgi:glycerol-3-phosphate acyltransferase PlsY
MVAVGSLLAAVAMPVLVWLWEYPLPYLILSICVIVLIIYRHQENIQRLIKGREKRV